MAADITQLSKKNNISNSIKYSVEAWVRELLKHRWVPPSPGRPLIVGGGGGVVQARYKWDYGGSSPNDDLNMIRRIKAEANCLRCSKHMDLVFSNRHLVPPSSSVFASASTSNYDVAATADSPENSNNTVAATNKGGGGGAYQEMNLCPNCNTTYMIVFPGTDMLEVGNIFVFKIFHEVRNINDFGFLN